MGNVIPMPNCPPWAMTPTWPPAPCPPSCPPDFWACYQQMAVWNQMLRDAQCNPIQGPITGVIDGSDAMPGQVGEFIQAASGPLAYTGYPNVTTLPVSLIVVQPGDWDFWARMQATTPTGVIDYVLSPVPAGMSNTMESRWWTSNPAGTTPPAMPIVNSYARGSFSQPTLLPFVITVNQQTGSTLTAGTVQMWIEGRRRR